MPQMAAMPSVTGGFGAAAMTEMGREDSLAVGDGTTGSTRPTSVTGHAGLPTTKPPFDGYDMCGPRLENYGGPTGWILRQLWGH
jgi:hypothetical protein